MSSIESILHENRLFPPSAEFVKQANVSGMPAYEALCAEAGSRSVVISSKAGQFARPPS